MGVARNKDKVDPAPKTMKGVGGIYIWHGNKLLSTYEMNSTIFWDVTPRSPLKVSRRFRGTYRLRLQGRRLSEARYQRESG
jgi:hypothetical protein